MEEADNQAIQPAKATQQKYAGFWRRLLAFNVDVLILSIFGVVLHQLFNTGFFLNNPNSLEARGYQLASFLISLSYFIYFWVNHDGATPGKKLLAIKIEKVDGYKLTYGVATVRELATLVSAFALSLGYLWVAWDKRKQAWHDKIAGTAVVETGQKPRKILAILLLIAAVLFYSVLFSVGVYLGFNKAGGFEKIKERSQAQLQVEEVSRAAKNLTPQAKIHYDKAQESFTKLRDSNKTNSDPKTFIPIANQAITEMKLAVDIEPNNPFLWNDLASAYSWNNSLGTAEDVVKSYQKTVELAPNNVIYINNLADYLTELGRFDQAILEYQKSLRLSNQSGYGYLGIAKAYAGLKIYNDARTNFEKAIEIFKSENKNGKYDQAILDAQKGLSALPK